MVSQTHTISPYLSIYSLSRTSNTRINSTLGLSADDCLNSERSKLSQQPSDASKTQEQLCLRTASQLISLCFSPIGNS